MKALRPEGGSCIQGTPGRPVRLSLVNDGERRGGGLEGWAEGLQDQSDCGIDLSRMRPTGERRARSGLIWFMFSTDHSDLCAKN